MSVPSALTPHAPLGAGARFDFGAPDSPAVFALDGGATLPCDFFVGCRHSAGAPWSLLPFFTARAGVPAPLPKGRYGRFLGWAGDKWMIGPLVFKLATPFDRETDSSDERFRSAPLLAGYLEYDNTHSDDPVELVFGFGATASPLAVGGGLGFALGPSLGFATALADGVNARRDGAVFGDPAIGAAAAFHYAVPPRTKRVHPIVVGFHQPGLHYATWFAGLAEVLGFGLAEHARYLAMADARDAEFMRSALPLAARAEAAQAVRSWLAQSVRRAGAPAVDEAGLRALCAAVK